jgi:hypothetical protein
LHVNPEQLTLYFFPMRRLVCVFLLIWFPFQISWAAVSSYCQHESGAAAQHFGHHFHVHHASVADDQAGSDHKGKGGHAHSVSVDNDCASCHLAAMQPLTCDSRQPALEASEVLVARLVQGHTSHIPDGLERPDIRLAA